MKESQLLQVQRHLAKGKRLTALDALKRFGCLRLAARIDELREQRWPVRVRKIDIGGKRVAEYSFDRRARK